ncbi:MAG: hypothetical protein DI619_00155 [Francisella sp.]|nr:MAG: hypothetical protein DI619_00155 [Francisella sp.]
MKNAIKILCLSGVLILGNSALAAPTKERGDVDRISSAFLNLIKEIQASNDDDQIGDNSKENVGQISDKSEDKDKTEQGIGSLDKLLKDLRALSGDQADAQNWLEQLQQELQRLLGGPQQAQSADAQNWLEQLQQELQRLLGGPQQAQSADAQNWLEQLQQELQRILGGPQQAQSA